MKELELFAFEGCPDVRGVVPKSKRNSPPVCTTYPSLLSLTHCVVRLLNIVLLFFLSSVGGRTWRKASQAIGGDQGAYSSPSEAAHGSGTVCIWCTRIRLIHWLFNSKFASASDWLMNGLVESGRKEGRKEGRKKVIHALSISCLIDRQGKCVHFSFPPVYWTDSLFYLLL